MGVKKRRGRKGGKERRIDIVLLHRLELCFPGEVLELTRTGFSYPSHRGGQGRYRGFLGWVRSSRFDAVIWGRAGWWFVMPVADDDKDPNGICGLRVWEDGRRLFSPPPPPPVFFPLLFPLLFYLSPPRRQLYDLGRRFLLRKKKKKILPQHSLYPIHSSLPLLMLRVLRAYDVYISFPPHALFPHTHVSSIPIIHYPLSFHLPPPPLPFPPS